MAGLKYLKELTDSLCLRDKGMRWDNEVLTLILDSGLISLCYLVVSLDKKIVFFKGSCLNKLEDKVGSLFKDSFREIVNLKDDNVILKSLNGALAGSDSKCCFLLNSSSFHCISRPLFDPHSEEISGAIFIILKEDWR